MKKILLALWGLIILAPPLPSRCAPSPSPSPAPTCGISITAPVNGSTIPGPPSVTLSESGCTNFNRLQVTNNSGNYHVDFTGQSIALTDGTTGPWSIFDLEMDGNGNPIGPQSATDNFTVATPTPTASPSPTPSPTPTPGPSQLHWGYSQGYIDPVHYFRSVGAGTTGGIPIATGAYPPGYHVSDGITVGGVFPTGTSNGTLPIQIQPPFAAWQLPTASGIGLFQTRFKCDVQNTSSTPGQIEMGLGVANVNGPNQPMFPWLGVQHDQEPLNGSMNPTTVPANSTIQYNGIRLDVIDNTLSTVPNWPNWTETPDPNNLLYPSVTLTYDNPGTVALNVGGCHVIGETIPY